MQNDNTVPEQQNELPDEPEQDNETHVEDDIAAVLAERDVLNDKYVRIYAEAENLRRRLDKEKTEAHQYAITNFARDLLGLADAFDQASKAMQADTDQSALKDGFLMTQKELHRVFEKHGITAINPAGEEFNHDLHQAMMKVPADDKTLVGNVATVMQIGFTLNGRLLRPALVSVAE